jgi:quercetin dioxygenase-like cupin family protein
MSSASRPQVLTNAKTGEEVISLSGMTFTPPQPLGDMTFSIASLWRQPETKANSMLVRLTKGADPRHRHTHDFYLVVVEGQIIHRTEGIDNAEEVVLGPGGYYFQPANTVHQDVCVSDTALVFCALQGDGETTYV